METTKPGAAWTIGDTETVERRRIPSGSPYEPIVGFSRALVAGAHVFVSGRAHGEIFSEVRPANRIVVVRGFVDPRWLVEAEAQAFLA